MNLDKIIVFHPNKKPYISIRKKMMHFMQASHQTTYEYKYETSRSKSTQRTSNPVEFPECWRGVALSETTKRNLVYRKVASFASSSKISGIITSSDFSWNSFSMESYSRHSINDSTKEKTKLTSESSSKMRNDGENKTTLSERNLKVYKYFHNTNSTVTRANPFLVFFVRNKVLKPALYKRIYLVMPWF